MSKGFWETELGEKPDAEFEKRREKVDPKNQSTLEESANSIPTGSPPGIAVAIAWLFTIAWCTGSVFLTFVIGDGLVSDLQTNDWEPVDGVVTDSYVSESSGGEGGTTYCLHVNYEYTVDGMTFQGDKVSYSLENNCNSWSENADEEYAEGEEITVYYDPSNPSDSVLEPGLTGINFFLCCFFVFPLIGLFMLYGSIRMTLSLFTRQY